MCRWLAYSGAPVHLDGLIFEPEHSLIDQSFDAHSTTTPTNADGFGLGWYGSREEPGVFKDIRPAWNDSNVRDLTNQIQSKLFLAHVRAATGTSVQRTNCHPFRYGPWLFLHNGSIRDFSTVKRELVLAVEPALYPQIHGTTDSELMFHLALTFGLAEDPIRGCERMVGFVEEVGRGHGIEHPINMTVGITDGKSLYAMRYSSQKSSCTLFHSRSVRALTGLNPLLERYSDDTRVIVSEPLTKLTHNWVEIPESTTVIVEDGNLQKLPFEPRSEDR